MPSMVLGAEYLEVKKRQNCYTKGSYISVCETDKETLNK